MKTFKRLTALCLTAAMVFGCVSFASAGSAEKKYTTETTADGWIKVTQEGGETLGYSPDSGVTLLEDDGFAFKDLNKNGTLDVYEDWRLDDETRAADLASKMTGEEIIPLMIHPLNFSKVISDSYASFDEGIRFALTYIQSASAAEQAKWSNDAQRYVEGKGYGIPVTISTDPSAKPSANAETWPLFSGIGSSFDASFAAAIAKNVAKQYSSIGITLLLGPNTDTETEPRHKRVKNSFGEDPALVRDMVKASISAYQSTYSEDGTDLGWGEDSVACITKHWPSDAPGQSGREGHESFGRYSVYPGNQFNTGLIAFVDGAFNLDGETGSAAGVMPSYSIAWSDDEEYGELVGSAFSEYKMKMLFSYGFGGAVISDWQILADNAHNYGVENLTPAERCHKAIKNGVDQIGGETSTAAIAEAYQLFIEEEGEEAALVRFQGCATRLLKLKFETQLFDNPYVSTENATSVEMNTEIRELAKEAQLKSVVMLKNDDNTIHEASEGTEKVTVYIPYVYRTAQKSMFGTNPATATLPVDLALAEQYFNVVTDTLSATLSGAPDEKGNATVAYEDIVRATPEQLAVCDFALVMIDSPTANSYGYNAFGYNGEQYIPLSLQYSEYTADSDAVRQESIAKMFEKEIARNIYAEAEITVEKDMTYFGETAVLTNSSDLDAVLYATKNMPENAKIIVAIAASNPVVVSEFESQVDAILFGYSTSDQAFLEVACGKYEPTGLLNYQMPANMETVEAQYEDVPRDMECYVDSNGNTYDFAFGLNWSGVINDERVQKYNVPALTEPETQIVK